MLINDEDKVGIKEYTAVVMISLGIKATDMTPVYFFKVAANAGWIVPIVSSVIVFISLSCMLTLLKRYENKNFIQIIYNLMGKYIGFVLGMLFSIYVVVVNSTNIRQYADIMSSIYFRKTPVMAISLILVVSGCIIAWLGFEAIGRISWMILPWIIVVVIFFIILVYNLIKVDYLYPLGGNGIKQILKGGVTYSGIFAELIFYSIIFPQVKSYKIFKNSSYIGFAYGVILLSFFSAIYIMVLDFPPAIINTAPFHTIARLIYGGRFLSNLEAFFFLFWIIATLVRFSMFAYVGAAIFTYTLKLNDIKTLVVPISALIYALSLIPDSLYKNAFIFRIISISSSSVFTYTIPCILLFLSQRKGDYKV